jgi:hypothetical protein
VIERDRAVEVLPTRGVLGLLDVLAEIHPGGF